MEKWQDPKVIALWISITIALIATIVFLVVRILYAGYKGMTEANLRERELKLEHHKKLMEAGLQAQEKERARIAADLHDSLIGKVAVIKMKNQLNASDSEINLLLEEVMNEARRISHDLTPPLLEFTGISELIDGVFLPWSKRYSINFINDNRRDDDLQPGFKIQILRVAQELLMNVIKHSKADAIDVQLRLTQTSFALTLSDNGRGFGVNEQKMGIGLRNLELRIEYLKATYKIKSVKGKGTIVIVFGIFK
ncbi:sensor histidine kinase [Flavobacterium suzhouense]|uniref:histidine kinase n=1 Tax=Flavobacterium suzhouense TaxID=1529638 RepID=A0ABW5NXH9_9FLAO